MTLISENYRALNRQLHADIPAYGDGRVTMRWYPQIVSLASNLNAITILDYGCGKSNLGTALSHLMVEGYDPAIAGKDDPPEPADLVVCLDVIEHIEPECVDNVLDDLLRCTIKGIFLTISTRPARKFLADGRNAHLSVHPPEWWLPKLMERWEIRMFAAKEDDFAFFGLAKQPERAAA